MDAGPLTIDGMGEVTNYYRGMGVDEKVVEAAKYLRRAGFEGDLIARMTVSRRSDVVRDVKHLLELGLFDHVHWQLDVVWSNLWHLEQFKEWAEESYKPGIKKLTKLWIKNIDNGRILGIVPFLGIMSRILHGGKDLPCQAGREAIAIATDGRIMACPIAPDFEWNILGDFKKYKRIEIGEPCKSCNVYKICGGRCMFAYKERLWGEEGFNEICNVTKFLIEELRKYKEKCMELKEKIRYPPYNNTTEIIP